MINDRRLLMLKHVEMSSGDVQFQPHRIPLTVIACFIGTCILVCGIGLLFKRNTFIGKRKAVQYMVLSSLGLLFYLRDSIAIVWTYPEYNNDVSTTYMYYMIAVPFHFIPVVVRSWRIFCVYRSTPTWQCTMEPITSRRKRGHQWMVVRMVVLYLPWVFTGIALIWTPFVPYYVDIGLNGIYAITNFVLTILLYTLRLELRPKYLDETSTLMLYSVLSLVEWIFANTIYILALLVDISGILVYYTYIDVLLVGLMWGLTTGKTAYRVYMRRDVVGDKKPGLEKSDIEKALQRVSVQLDKFGTINSTSINSSTETFVKTSATTNNDDSDEKVGERTYGRMDGKNIEISVEISDRVDEEEGKREPNS